MISVIVPVGPFPGNRKWLAECIDSVREQSVRADEILLIDDMAGLYRPAFEDCRIYQAPWRLGVAHAFNFGVALAENDLVFMLGSDDILRPRCLEKCVDEWERNNREDAYYYVGVHYLDGRESANQTTPCNAAMVTKGLWRKTGGFPVEAASGAPDAALISILMAKRPAKLIGVAGGAPLYDYRPHEGTDTAMRGPWQGVILGTRDILSATWSKPAWGRYE